MGLPDRLEEKRIGIMKVWLKIKKEIRGAERKMRRFCVLWISLDVLSGLSNPGLTGQCVNLE